MKNEMIAKVLKETRKRNSLSVKDVVLELKNKSLSVAEKTVYGWESGQSQPDADTLLLLCEIYNIDDILGTFGYNDTPPLQITDFEKKLILNLRAHPEMLDAVKKLLDME
ncbi:MAG: helix-turn-helix transcriptional regulator [Lachnospiraceae bacterium]|nr:helix-turn-helix transcriptional regulator [Lachnospiraceae bacterium]